MRPYYYLGTNWALTQLSNGLPFFVNTDDRGISTWIVLGGTWENFVDDIMQDILRPNDVCLDVGANLGYYTIKMAHAVGPEGRVLAFEPNAELYPFLTENVSINGFASRVKTYPKAVGACAGAGSLKFDYSNMGGGYIDTSVPGDIEIIAIDELPDVPNRVDFIKIDVEGMEPLAFAGMVRLLQRSLDCVIIAEYSKGHWQRFGDPVKLLEEIQGSRSKFWIGHDGKLTIPDGTLRRDNDGVSYVLLIHKSDERFRRVMHRIEADSRQNNYGSDELISTSTVNLASLEELNKVCRVAESVRRNRRGSRKSAVWKVTRPLRGLAESLRRDRRGSRQQAEETGEREHVLSVPIADCTSPETPPPTTGLADQGTEPKNNLSDMADDGVALEQMLEHLLQRGQTSVQNKTELLRECVREFRNVKWNVKVLGYHLAHQLAKELPSVSTIGMPTRIGLTSKACVQEDVDSAWFGYWAARLKSAPIYHRKLWEFCYILQALFDSGALRRGANCVGFGCGEEPLPSLFASMGISVTATDAPRDIIEATGWAATKEYSYSVEALFKPFLCDRQDFNRLVSLSYVDMNEIPSSFREKFDFTWSSCALEHLGSIANGLRFIEKSLNCVKPGGVAVHTTEWNFTSEEETIDHQGTVLFQRGHFEHMAQCLSEVGYKVQPLDFRMGSGLLDKFIDIPPYESHQEAHLRLTICGFGATSFGIIVNKPAEFGR